MAKLRYIASAGAYDVMLGDVKIGRVAKTRRSYDHSNGRTYRFWCWSALPPLEIATFHHSTRAKAGAYLLKQGAAVKEEQES